jgi:hypothetical protein
MMTAEEHGWIGRAYRDGMSLGEVTRTFHHSRRKIREMQKTIPVTSSLTRLAVCVCITASPELVMNPAGSMVPYYKWWAGGETGCTRNLPVIEWGT